MQYTPWTETCNQTLTTHVYKRTNTQTFYLTYNEFKHIKAYVRILDVFEGEGCMLDSGGRGEGKHLRGKVI